MATAKTQTEDKNPTAPDEVNGESKPQAPKAATPGQVDGTIETPAEAQADAIEQLKAQHKTEIEQINAEHKQALAAVDPTKVVVDTDAFDATRPRGPEAPNETLKPGQRQGQGIPAGAGANETATGDASIGTAGDVPESQELDESLVHPLFREPKEESKDDSEDAPKDKKKG